MDAQEIQHAIFDLLYHEWVQGKAKPVAFVGLQGEHVVVMQPGGEHYGITVVGVTKAQAS